MTSLGKMLEKAPENCPKCKSTDINVYRNPYYWKCGNCGAMELL